MTPDGDLGLDEWGQCAATALEQLSDEIDALDADEQQRFVDALLRTLGEPDPA